jgi:glycine hydroxymethyltransferase
MSLEHLAKTDPDLHAAVRAEVRRQQTSLELIASENSASEAVIEAMGTPLTNKYSEGYPGARYYGGNEHIDVVERLAIDRAKALFGAEHANVQPHAGSTANLAAYLALAAPGDRLLGMDLAHGGHLTHGAAVSATGKFFEAHAYGVRRDTHLLDMDEVRQKALAVHPRVLVAGYSAYPRTLDFAAFRAIAEEVGAYLLVDMAHFAGLVAAGVHESPVPYADVVTSTTHKTLRGPRGGLILSTAADRLRPESPRPLARRLDSAVMPGTQGGPLDHVIAAKAVCFKEALDPAFRDYGARVVANARALAAVLVARGLKVLTGGTDNHLVLLDVTAGGLTGAAAERLLGEVGISVNRNLIPFDERKPGDPSGLRLGTAAATTRGLGEAETREVGELIADRLQRPDDETVRARVARRVAELTAAFPIYPDWP